MGRIAGLTLISLLIAITLLMALRIVLPLSVEGTSMLPTYRPGDLVIALREHSPDIGDVVAYHDGHSDAVFIHRVVDVTPEGRLVLKGDNNDFTDSYQPLPTEVMGRAVLHVPRLGGAVIALRSPLVLAGGALALLGLLLAPARPRRPRSAGRQRSPADAIHVLPLAAGAGALLLAAGSALSAWAWTLPAQTQVSEPISYRHTGRWEYHAPGTGQMWDDPQGAHTGDPLSWRLNDQVTFIFNYSLVSEATLEVHSRGRLIAALSAPGYGWRRTFELSPWQEMHSSSISLSGTLRLRELQRLQDSIRAEAGLPAAATLLEVTAQVETAIRAGSVSLQDRFEATLPFQGDGAVLRPSLQTSPSGPSALAPLRPGSIPRTATREGTLPGPLSFVPVGIARAAGAAAAAAGAMLLLTSLVAFLRLDPLARAVLLLPNAIPAEQLPPDMPSVPVSSRRRLVSTAQKLGLPLIVARTGEVDLATEGMLFVWRGPPSAAASADSPISLPAPLSAFRQRHAVVEQDCQRHHRATEHL
jgi:signal peptidase I